MGHLPAPGVLLRRPAGALAAALALLLAVVLAGCGTSSPSGPSSVALTPSPGSSTPAGHGTSASGGVPTVAYADLPPEAHHTIDLIDRGGPYPYRQDDGVFGNREGLLPDEPEGYYRKYTVVTPGSPDRGARRIIAARDGTLYYTDDHYQSFARVER